MPHQCLSCGNLFAEGSTTILRGCPDCRGTRFFYTKEALTLTERERLLTKAQQDMPALLERLTQEVKQRAEAVPTAPPAPMPKPASPPPSPLPPAFDPPTARGQGTLTPDGKLLIKLPKNLKQRVQRASTGWDYDAPTPLARSSAAAPDVLWMRGQPTVAAPEARPGPEARVAPPVHADAPASADAAPVVRIEAEPLAGMERPETVHIPASGQYEIDVRRLLDNSPIIVQKDGSYVIHLASVFEASPKRRA